LQSLTETGVNWFDFAHMTEAGVNWFNFGSMTTAGVNWDDLAVLSTADVNWQDISYMTGTGINWIDMSSTSRAGVNWSDLAAMTSANIDWEKIAYLADHAEDLVTNVDTILGLIGAATDAPGVNTLFGKIAQVRDIVDSMDLTALEAVVDQLTGIDFDALTSLGIDMDNLTVALGAVETNIGSVDDTSAAETVFGSLKKVQDYVDTLETIVGASGDTSAGTVFAELAKLTDITTQIGKTKSAAESGLSEIQGVRKEIGAQGLTPTVYERLKKLDGVMEELKIASEAISQSQLETGNVASEMLSKLSNFLNESAKALGIEGEAGSVEDLEPDEATDIQKVHEKLTEINTKLDALREAAGNQGIAVKSWFESAE
jgi:hypothetical protein